MAKITRDIFAALRLHLVSLCTHSRTFVVYWIHSLIFQYFFFLLLSATIAAYKSVRYFSNGCGLKKRARKKRVSRKISILLLLYVFTFFFAPGLIKFEVAHNANIAHTHTHHGTQTMAIANLFNCKLKMRDWKIKRKVKMRGLGRSVGGGRKMFERLKMEKPEKYFFRVNDNWFDYCLIKKIDWKSRFLSVLK